MTQSTSSFPSSALLRGALIASTLLYIGSAIVLVMFGQMAADELNGANFGMPFNVAAIPLLLFGVVTMIAAISDAPKIGLSWFVAIGEALIVALIAIFLLVWPEMRGPSILFPMVGGGFVVAVLAALKFFSLRARR